MTPGVRVHERFGREGPVDRWRALRDEIHAEVLDRAWSAKAQAFAQSYDSDEPDASCLLMPVVGFLPPSDERVTSTIEAIRQELTVDGLVLRYRPRDDAAVDGISGGEGVFLPCSFWLADALALQGKLDEARELFERLLDLRNDIGLLSEEYDPVSGRQLGNFSSGIHASGGRQHCDDPQPWSEPATHSEPVLAFRSPVTKRRMQGKPTRSPAGNYTDSRATTWCYLRGVL